MDRRAGGAVARRRFRAGCGWNGRPDLQDGLAEPARVARRPLDLPSCEASVILARKKRCRVALRYRTPVIILPDTFLASPRSHG